MVSNLLLNSLIAARRDGTLIDDLPPAERPATLDDAYATADALAAAVGKPVAGWKVGASIARAWERLGLAEPFGGRIFEGTIYSSGATMPDVPGMLTIGAEFAFHISRDLDASETRFDAESVREVVSGVYPVLEPNRPSYEKPFEMGGLCLIADNGVNVGLVLGTPIPDWCSLDLRKITVGLLLNGELKTQGAADDIGFDPFAALAWLANDRAKRGDPLRAGQYVSSGDLTGAVEASPGDRVAADFGTLGAVDVQLS